MRYLWAEVLLGRLLLVRAGGAGLGGGLGSGAPGPRPALVTQAVRVHGVPPGRRGGQDTLSKPRRHLALQIVSILHLLSLAGKQ